MRRQHEREANRTSITRSLHGPTSFPLSLESRRTKYSTAADNAFGYARVSTIDQTPDLQLDALRSAGVSRIFVETASGAKADRPELKVALDYVRPGDALVVWKLDRLARSITQLISTVELLD